MRIQQPADVDATIVIIGLWEIAKMGAHYSTANMLSQSVLPQTMQLLVIQSMSPWNSNIPTWMAPTTMTVNPYSPTTAMPTNNGWTMNNMNVPLNMESAQNAPHMGNNPNMFNQGLGQMQTQVPPM